MIIGLTGKSCSGKNMFAKLMDKDRFEVIDEDYIGHIALDENKNELVSAFGSQILSQDGKIDRKKLSPIVFSSEEKLSLLNSIVHPWMVKKTLDLCKKIEQEGKNAVINAAILEKMGFVPYCDQVVLVLSKYENRLERALNRDDITEDAFKRRSDMQKDIGSSLFSSGKKIVTIFNDGTEEQLSNQARFYCDSIKSPNT